MSMMTLKNVSIEERKTGRKLIDKFDLTINPGDKIAIIGEEGNGKSTLLKVMNTELPIPNYIEMSGDIISSQTVVGYLSQHQQVDDGMRVIDLFPEVDWNDDLLKAMNDFKVDNLFSEQTINTLSGGEKTRYFILSVLAKSPDILLLDEPTNDIDIHAIEWLEKFIKETTLPVVYVSHDEVFIERTANCIVHLELAGRKDVPIYTIDYQGYSDYRQRRDERIQKNEHDIKSQKRAHAEKEAKLQQVWQKAEHQHQHVNRADPRLQKKIANLKNQRKRLDNEESNIGEIIAYEKESYFSFAYLDTIQTGKKLIDVSIPILENDKGVLSNDVQLSIYTGDKIVITGGNGVGKSTLLKEIYEQMKSRNVGYMPQDYTEVLPSSISPVDFLNKTGEASEKTMIYTSLGNMNFTRDEMITPLGLLSGGQQAKVLLLRMIVDEREILILDEPTRNLSPITNPQLYKELAEFKGTIISVSHDRKYIEELGMQNYELSEKGLRNV